MAEHSICQPGRPRPQGESQLGVLALLVRLPQCKILRRLLHVGRIVALSLLHLLQRPVGQPAVVREARHAEVDVTAGLVGVAGVHERFDQLDDRPDRLGGPRLGVRPAQRQAIGVLDVGLGHLRRQLGAGNAALAGGVVDLVVHVGDVGHEARLVAFVLEEALEQGEHDVGAGVAHVHAPVDGRAARVDRGPPRLARLQRHAACRAGCRSGARRARGEI